MIQVIKDFYKQSEKKNYYVGDKATFSKADETTLIRTGYAKIVPKKSK